MIDNIASGIVCIFALSLCCSFLFEFKKTKTKTFIIFSCVAIFLRALLPLKEIAQFNLLASTFLYTFIPLYFFNGRGKSKILFILVYYMGSLLCEIFTMNIFAIFFEDMILQNSVAFYLGLFTTNIMLIPIMYIFSLYYKTFRLNSVPSYSWVLLFLPFATILILWNIKDYIESVISVPLFGITTLGLLLANISCIYIYYKTVTTISNEKELQQELEKKNLEYEAATNLLSQHNIFLHSIRNQSTEMMKLLEEKEYKKLEEYIQDVYADSTNVYNMINSNYEIADMIINDRIYIIKNNDIQLRIKLESTDFKPCSINEMEKIFKSLVDLGIHECIHSNASKPFLNIKSKQIENQIILTFMFSSTGIDDKAIDQEVVDIFNKHDIYFLIDNNEDLQESSISILFSNNN